MSGADHRDGPRGDASAEDGAELGEVRPSRTPPKTKRRSLRVPVDEVPRRSSLRPSAQPAGAPGDSLSSLAARIDLAVLSHDDPPGGGVPANIHAIAPPAPAVQDEADFGDLGASWEDQSPVSQASSTSAANLPVSESIRSRSSKEPGAFDTAFSAAYSAIEPAMESAVTTPGTTTAPSEEASERAEEHRRSSQPAVVVAQMVRVSEPPPAAPADDEPELSFGEFDTFEELEEDGALPGAFSIEESGELELPEEEPTEEIDDESLEGLRPPIPLREPAQASASSPALDAEEELDEIDVVPGGDLDSSVGPKKKPRSVPPPPREPPTRDKSAKAALPASGAAPASVDRAVSEPPRPAKKKTQWWEDFFSDDYLRTVSMPSARQIARQCDFIESRLALKPGGTILDVGCGLGLQAIELTRRGYLVVGLDLSLPMLSRAADEAQDQGFRINFLHADMREMNFDGAFDAVMCIGTTFGYFDDDANRALVERLYRALRPKGKLLLEVVNRDFVVKNQPNLVWFEGDGCVVMEETSANYITSRLEVKRNVMLDDGRQRDNHYSVRLYALHELGLVLHQRGFRVLEVSGREATPGVFFGADSPKLIILAERRAQPTPQHQSAPPTKS